MYQGWYLPDSSENLVKSNKRDSAWAGVRFFKRDVQCEVIHAICRSDPLLNIATSGIHPIITQKGILHYQVYKFSTPGLPHIQGI